MATNLTRINNNQISTASAGNAQLGINASTKVQGYTITGGLLANTLTYGSDLTIAGNLIVQGTTTAIDTVNTLIQDPLLTLADGQTAGTPTVDIGTIGLRGNQNSAVLAWKESDTQFVAALSSTTVSNTTFTLSSYADFKANTISANANLNVTGVTSFVGNIISGANVTGTVTGGNLATPGTASATGSITGGNLLTGGNVSATGNATAGNLLITGSGIISTAGTIYGANLILSSTESATGNLTAGNILTGGEISAAGNITSNASSFFIGNGSMLTGVTASSVNANSLTGNTLNAGVVNSSLTSVGVLTSLSVSGNTISGNVSGTNLTGTDVSVTGTATAASTVGGVITGSSSSVTGTQTAASTVGGVITGSSSSVTGTQTAASTVGGVITGSSSSVTGTQTAASTVGGVITGSSSSVTGTQTAASTVGGVITGTSVSVTGNVDSGNVTTGILTSTSTVGGVITGSSSSVTGTQTAASTVGGVITGSSSSVTGTQTAASTVGGVITGSSSSVTGTQTAASTVGGVITGSSASVTGTATAASTVGGVITGSSTSVTGNTTAASLNANTVYNSTDVTVTAASGTITLNPTGNILVSSKNINNLADPVQDQDAATKIYVDTVAQGLDPKASVVYATISNLSAYTYNNGASGVGATLTAQAVGNLTIDGAVVSAGQRVLIKNEVGAYVNTTTQSAAFNGIYVVTTAGAPGTAYLLTRATDFDNGTPSGEIPGAFTFVESGATEADTGWVCTTNSPVTVGTTQITWTQFSGAGSYTANTAAGLTLVGSVFNAKVDDLTTAFDGSGNISVKVSAQLTTPNIGAATGTSLSVTGTVTSSSTVGGVITGSSSSVTGTQTAASTVGGVITGSSSSVTGTQTAASTVGGVITGSSASVTGAVTGASLVGTVTTAAQASITSVGTLTALTVSGAITVNSSNAVTAIINGGTAGSGNIGASGAGFNTVYAKATTAQYADLAEKYTADAEYAPGTVLVFGGSQEVTANATDADSKVAGVVSTNPGFVMNEGLDTEFAVAVALTGRVPTSVTGTVRKGDLMVSAGNGQARAEANPRVGTVIGKALADSEGDAVIEVVVGRF